MYLLGLAAEVPIGNGLTASDPKPVSQALGSACTAAVAPSGVATVVAPKINETTLVVDIEKADDVVVGDTKRRRLKRTVEEE